MHDHGQDEIACSERSVRIQHLKPVPSVIRRLKHDDGEKTRKDKSGRNVSTRLVSVKSSNDVAEFTQPQSVQLKCNSEENKASECLCGIEQLLSCCNLLFWLSRFLFC